MGVRRHHRRGCAKLERGLGPAEGESLCPKPKEEWPLGLGAGQRGRASPTASLFAANSDIRSPAKSEGVRDWKRVKRRHAELFRRYREQPVWRQGTGQSLRKGRDADQGRALAAGGRMHGTGSAGWGRQVEMSRGGHNEATWRERLQVRDKEGEMSHLY